DEALEHFRGGENNPEALEGIGIAQWWLDDADARLEARECSGDERRWSEDGLGRCSRRSSGASTSWRRSRGSSISSQAVSGPLSSWVEPVRGRRRSSTAPFAEREISTASRSAARSSSPVPAGGRPDRRVAG